MLLKALVSLNSCVDRLRPTDNCREVCRAGAGVRGVPKKKEKKSPRGFRRQTPIPPFTRYQNAFHGEYETVVSFLVF